MDALFSCRNCIHNPIQSVSLGKDHGFCLKHDSVIYSPDTTTCKYLHRKDLPRFAVDEGVRAHAAEFAFFSGMVGLYSMQPVQVLRYSEKFLWERGQFSPMLHAIAQYHKMEPHWIMVQAYSGSIDGIRALVHASLVRHYLDTCGNWRTSYRLILALIQEFDFVPAFSSSEFSSTEKSAPADIEAAQWDVLFSRLSGIQEYGWHAGLEDLTWLTDRLNGSLSNLDIQGTLNEFSGLKKSLTERIITHTKSEGVFFSPALVDKAEVPEVEG